jgi:hypothetical protein
MFIGPAADELVDFEQTSLPRRRPFSFGRFLTVVTVAAVFFLTGIFAVACLQWFKTNSSDNLILGTWRSVDHPQFSTITFSKGGNLAVKDKTRNLQGAYRFLAQYTIEFYLFDQREHFYHWKVKLRGDAMTITDADDGTFSQWSRL